MSEILDDTTSSLLLSSSSQEPQSAPAFVNWATLVFNRELVLQNPFTADKSLSRQEFITQLTTILYKSYDFPRTLDDVFHDPGLLLITSISCMVFAVLIIVFVVRSRQIQKRKHTSNNNLSSAEAQPFPTNGILRPPSLNLSAQGGTMHSPKRTEAMNTDIDIDDFMNRLFANGIIVTRHKPNNIIKTRCLKLNAQCDLCIFKQFKEKTSNHRQIITIGGPYMRIPLQQLCDCFPCEGSTPPTFILDFTSKTIQLSAEFILDNHYLIQGFKNLLTIMKRNPQYLRTWQQKFQQKLKNANNNSKGKNSKSSSVFYFFSSPSKGSNNQDDHEDDLQSVSTVNTMLTR